MVKALIASVALLAAIGDAPSAVCAPDSAGRRGCCSHHHGVCGCNQATGMQRCCDGTDSPSCHCGE